MFNFLFENTEIKGPPNIEIEEVVWNDTVF